jgi:excinuclease ABC subunit C
LEEVWLPGDEFPVILPRTSEALYLLQRVRDEAHRFAITFHRERRSKRMTTSRLDGVPGLGEIRRKALLTRFGSVKRLAAASAEEIASVPGIGDRTAAAIVAALSGDGSPGPAPGGEPSGGRPHSDEAPRPAELGRSDGTGTGGGTGSGDTADRAGAGRP